MMQTRIPAPAEANKQQSHSAQPATQLLAEQQSTFEDHRPQAAQLISLQAMMSNSPPQQRTQTRQAKMNDSAQALQMRTLPTGMTGGDVAQRESLEEPLQAERNVGKSALTPSSSRATTIAQRQIREMANSSPKTVQQKTIQRMTQGQVVQLGQGQSSEKKEETISRLESYLGSSGIDHGGEKDATATRVSTRLWEAPVM